MKIPVDMKRSWTTTLSKLASVSVSTNWKRLKDLSEDTHMGSVILTIKRTPQGHIYLGFNPRLNGYH